jgi:subtilisin family serine protease
VQIIVELSDTPSSATYSAAYEQARIETAALEVNKNRPPALTAGDRPVVRVSDADLARYESATQSIDAKQQALLPALTGPAIGGQVIYRTQRAYNGIAMVVSSDKISEIASLPGVKAVHALTPKSLNAFSDLDFLGARGTGGAWNKAYTNGVGLHGENLKIVVIDTGLDYVHTNFGGPGTQAAYAAVNPTTAPNPYFPSAKVPNGTDLCGDTYNAVGTGAALIPQPDPNPFDGVNGHGTGCASLAAGYGVNAGGTTYIGNYDDTTPIASLKISPGFAPQAKIYPVRIIGAGSTTTTLEIQAVDWALNPANFGGTLPDVISMSIGGPDGRFDDPSEIAFTNAATAGVLCTLSAGNSGNTYYIQGGPSAANRILAVAASFNDQGGYIYDATVTGNQPASLAGRVGYAIRTTNSSSGVVTADVVQLKPNDSPASNTPVSNAAQISGKICLVDRVPGQGAFAAQRCKTAGAIGIIYIANIEQAGGDPFVLTTGPTTAPQIPECMISTQDGNNLKAAAMFDPSSGVSTSTPPANVTVNTSAGVNGSVTHGTTATDTITSYSSRGPRLIDSYLKPDITAPAEIVGIARTLTGNGVALFNGTSSAAPHVGGIMVLLKQLHPTWTVDELLALVSNTANHDIWSGPSTGQGGKQGVSRVGAGRVDIKAAIASDVIVYNSTDAPGITNLSFGVIDCLADGVAESTRRTKNITVKNKGTSPVTYNLSYQDITPASDAGFQTTAPLNFTVAAGGSVTIPITFAATGHIMKHSRDATVPPTQVGNPRQWLTEKAGYAVFTPTTADQPVLRLALHATPRPAGTMHAANPNPSATGDAGSMNIQLAGNAVNTGNNFSGTNGQPGQDVVGLMKAFDLQYASPKIGTNQSPSGPMELKYAGVTSDYAARNAAGQKLNTVLAFMTETFADASHPRFTTGERDLYIDANSDGTDDFVMFNTTTTDASVNSHTNVFVTSLLRASNFSAVPGGTNFINGFPSTTRDTNAYNQSIQIFFVPASLLGYNGGPTKFKYRWEMYDGLTGNLADSTPYLTYDVANPGFTYGAGIGEPYYFNDLPGNLAVNYSGANTRNFSTSTKGLLLAHMHNASGQRTDVVAFAAPSISDFQPKSGPVGTNVLITGFNFSPGCEVFFNGTQATNVQYFGPGQIQAQVPPGATDGPITVRNPGGTASTAGLDDPATTGTNEGIFDVTP